MHTFDDINWKLEGDVLRFVNTMADVVHNCVSNWGGQTNKNLGNAWVIVWRIGDEDTLLKQTQAHSFTKTKHGKHKEEEESALKKRKHVVDLARVAGLLMLIRVCVIYNGFLYRNG